MPTQPVSFKSTPTDFQNSLDKRRSMSLLWLLKFFGLVLYQLGVCRETISGYLVASLPPVASKFL